MADLSKIRLRDVVNPRKWFAFLQGYIMTKFVSLEYCEQVVYRSIMCTPCVKKGSCIDCGCTMPDAIMARNNYCSEGMWGPMYPDARWKEYKANTGLHFKVDIDLSGNDQKASAESVKK